MLVTESTRNIVVFKVPNNKTLTEEFFKQQLSSNGILKISIPTSKADDGGFTVKVSMQ